ncbi:hypothetical protein NPIL_484341 [Nephila pilipes]|uniref:Uncharacterized protein n=1 Tax=Nephila pilipes TaxID=299642 RepID=A0A8X6MLT2_NEPPI|nr:hypothetical protein NPIL_466991 [Nephila pilipes]GFS64237.1 hypothetical protein NPIL_484341 [Nephila pilipes]
MLADDACSPHIDVSVQKPIVEQNLLRAARPACDRVVSMLNPPNGHLGNPNKTGDIPRTSTGIVLYQVLHGLLIV